MKKKKIIDISILSAFIFVISLIIFRRYILGGYYFLSKEYLGDSLRVSLPTYYHLYDNLFGGEGGFWSWRMGIGTSMFSHGEFFFDPLTYIVFLGGREHIPDMMIWCFIVRIIAMGIVFYLYISHFKLRREACIIASMAYAFCGSVLITGDFFQESPILLYFPLICLGIEKWLDEDKNTILIIGLFLNAIYTFYYYYIAGIVVFIYLWGRMSFRSDRNRIVKRTIGLIGYEVLGICFGGFSIFPQVDLMLNSPRVLGNNDIEMGGYLLKPYTSTLITALTRVMGLNVLNGPERRYLGTAFVFNDYFQITTYISAFIYIFLFQLLGLKKEYRKRAIAYAMIGITMTAIPLFSFIVNAFSTINYRWMFIIPLVGCVVTAYSIDAIEESGSIPFGWSMLGTVVSIGTLIVGELVLAYKSGGITIFLKDIMQGSMLYIATVIIGCIIYMVTAWIFRDRPGRFYIILCGLLMSIDMIINAGFIYGGTEDSVMEYTEQNNACYSDTSADIISEIQRDDHSFFRINKDYDSVVCTHDQNSCNDAMVQGYYGLKSYNSMNNKNYIYYLWENDVYVTPAANVSDYRRLGVTPAEVWSGQELNYIEGVYDRYDLMNYLGVKYFLTRDKDKTLPESMKLINEQEGIYIYMNLDAYPLAFVEDDEVQEMQQRFELLGFSSDEVRFNLDVAEDGSEVTFSIPYDRDWHILVDNIETKHIMRENYLLGCMMDAGDHEVRLKYVPIVFYSGMLISILSAIAYGIVMSVRRRYRMA